MEEGAWDTVRKEVCTSMNFPEGKSGGKKKRVYVRLVGSTKERLAYMKKFIEEFKAFALKGNMVDLAVGMINSAVRLPVLLIRW